MMDLPVRKNIHISGLNRGTHTVSVYNLNEQVEMKTTLTDSNQFITVDNLDAGIYFLKVVSTSNGESKTYKFLKE